MLGVNIYIIIYDFIKGYMASSLQRVKSRKELERIPYCRWLFTVNYKWSWYWYKVFKEYYEHPKFRKRSTLEKFYNDYYK